MFSICKVKSRLDSYFGWTLIELLVVLLMLSLLMTLVMPQVSFVTLRAEKMAARQLLLETLATVQIRDALTVEESCQQFYQREELRFSAFQLRLQCSAVSKNEIRIAATSKRVGEFQLSSLHGFLDEKARQ